MRALVLGGHGAIGSAIARYADARGMETHVVARSDANAARLAAHPRIVRHRIDASDTESLRGLLQSLRPDWVVMAAFSAGVVAECAETRRATLEAMSNAMLGVLESLAHVGFPGTITWIGSALAYGAGDKPRDPGDALKPQSWRGAVKAAESLLARQFATAQGLRLTELRVFTGHGPFEQPKRLVPSLMRAALAGSRVRLATVPAARDWIHYDDIARACEASIAAPSGTFNLCSGMLADTRAIAGIVESIVGMELVAPEPWEGVDSYGDVEPGVLPDTSLLPWSPTLALADGLRETWSWANTRAGREWLEVAA